MVSEALSGIGAPTQGNLGRLQRRRWRIRFEASKGFISGANISNAGVA